MPGAACVLVVRGAALRCVVGDTAGVKSKLDRIQTKEPSGPSERAAMHDVFWASGEGILHSTVLHLHTSMARALRPQTTKQGSFKTGKKTPSQNR